MSSPKIRLDARLVEDALFSTKEKARGAIMAGLVYVDGQRRDKPGYPVEKTARIQVRGKKAPYVSRGGLKLEKALKSFHLDLNGLTVLDAGASTGGFTDCALRHGAALVYAVDVGYGQLAWSLRQDPRVIVMERTNIRYLTSERLASTPDFALVDLSFISLAKVLPRLFQLLRPEGAGVALIKPQFEANREMVEKKGLVRDPSVHRLVLEQVTGQIEQLGKQVVGLDFSPITGPAGNIEYLVYFAGGAHGENRPPDLSLYANLVDRAHEELG